ncbi:class I glutamine amidotransferase-like protein [Vararia minispora EC-137]|uniref:Class I glutamine amidotransferase-like protein n=1 Tax=Vararia minispora EC-137 TaxID=1314806 RepID=A0ACB8QZJ5_9AGAM|nr:class I glutamine amidotransferase-like protein [Vararia minispora EC-137]
MTRILLVYTSCNKTLTGGQTGWYLPEAAHPYYTFLKAGFDMDFASPNGPNPPIDENSVKNFTDDESQSFLQDTNVQGLFANAKPLRDVDPAKYDAIFYVGGHGPVMDLATDPNNIDVANKFYRSGKLVSAVCHGTAALAGVTDADGKSIFAGRTVTGFSNAEEEAIDRVKDVPFLLESKAIELGANFIKADPWAAKVAVDGKVFTGQNPASAKPLAEEIVKALKA